MTNEDKKKKYRCGFKNKLIIFIYYLTLFFYFKSFLLNIFNLFNDLN